MTNAKYRIEGTDYVKFVNMEELQDPPLFCLKFSLTTIDDFILKISKKCTTSDLIDWFSYFLTAPKDRIVLMNKKTNVTDESLSELNGNLLNI